jgi:hypothetical protein
VGRVFIHGHLGQSFSIVLRQDQIDWLDRWCRGKRYLSPQGRQQAHGRSSVIRALIDQAMERGIVECPDTVKVPTQSAG